MDTLQMMRDDQEENELRGNGGEIGRRDGQVTSNFDELICTRLCREGEFRHKSTEAPT